MVEFMQPNKRERIDYRVRHHCLLLQDRLDYLLEYEWDSLNYENAWILDYNAEFTADRNEPDDLVDLIKEADEWVLIDKLFDLFNEEQ